MSFKKLLFVILLFFSSPPICLAEELITYYSSDIQVLENSELIITETIKVVAEGKEIKRGIYRDFPTDYRDDKGNRVKVGFDVLSVKRNGSEEPYHTKRHGNGVRVYVGDVDVFIPQGVHTYELIYKTNQQLGFFENHDELYFNAIGHGWIFKILQGDVSVRLPMSVPMDKVKVTAYSGSMGEKGRNYTSQVHPYQLAAFSTIEPLPKFNGLTVVVEWPKGHVTEPDFWTKVRYFFDANPAILVGLTGLFGLFAFYMVAWVMVGVDPQKGTIIPRFEAPENISPQEARFLHLMEYDERCFASSLMHMASNGAIELGYREKGFGGGNFSLRSKNRSLAKGLGEANLLEALIPFSKSIVFSNTYHARISESKRVLERSLESKHLKRNFEDNRMYWFIGLGLMAVIGIAMLLADPEIFTTLFFTVFISTFLFLFLYPTYMALKEVFFTPSFTRIVLITLSIAPVLLFFAIIFIVSDEIDFGMIDIPPSMWLVFMFIVMAILFKGLLKAPTLRGRALMDAIEGYKMYLGTAERDRLAKIQPEEINQKLFEKHLPFAFALGVEQEWTEAFIEAMETRGEQVDNVNPSWFDGPDSFSTPSAMTSALGGGLATAIASSSVAPGSSSGGSGGGGSSGGGGGGGGGGGW